MKGIKDTDRRGLWNDLLCSEGREQFLHDIIFIQLGLDILEGNITKSSQADLSETVIKVRIAQERYEANLVCLAIDGFWGAWFNHESARRRDVEPSRMLRRVPFIWRIVILGLLHLRGGYTL